MIILGLTMGHDGTAAVIRDGRLVLALSRERFSRVKKQAGVDNAFIHHVLKAAGTRLEEVEYVAFASHKYTATEPKIYTLDTNEVVKHEISLYVGEYHRNYWIEIGGRKIKAVYVHHQLAHCASAFFTSPFEKAACLSMDSSLTHPENCSLYAVGSGTKLQPIYCPGLMIGNMYHEFTQKLGLGEGLFKAGSTMGLASYGTVIRHPLHEEFLKNYFDRKFQLDREFIHWVWMQLSGKLPFDIFKEIDQDAMNIAATLQHLLEEVTLAAAKKLLRETERLHEGNLVLSGGSFLNCNANTNILKNSGFKNAHLFQACGDDGTAVGAALYLAHNLLNLPREKYSPKDLAYLGIEYEAPEGGAPLDLNYIADEISRGKVVAWMQGKSEFGPRALGHRSILADPRSPTMRDYLNNDVKKREWFRPFAPAVLEEDAREWFDVEWSSPFMLHTVTVKKPDRVPAITHVDGTARIQTVSQKETPLFYELIKRFKEKTGVPMLLNTSFNLGGEPLVETPEDALKTFRESKIDHLVIGNALFSKDPSGR